MTFPAVALLVAGVAGAEASELDPRPERPSPPAAPAGFEVSLAAGEPETVFPMFAAFDDRGRLFVAESSGLDLYAELQALTRRCRIKLLEDRDGDGRFESALVFADKLVFPMGLAWRDGVLYAADPPDLVALEDTDGDGRADTRRVLLTGFGHQDNGSLHGLLFGPDGLLYFTMGSPDGYRLRRADGSLLQGESGALLRCRADGSGVEVLARGFVNLIEVAFLEGGECVGTDNWYQEPRGGLRDALVHLVEGGLYPYHPDRGTPQPVTGDPLPPLALFPAVALSGICLEAGPSFPGEMRGSLFTAQHNARRVARHVLEREGSTFRARTEDFLTSQDPDFHPSDVLQDAAGDLLVVDTGGWYVQHCPTGRIRESMARGGIWRVRRRGAPPIEDPWGLALAGEGPGGGVDTGALARLLSDPRPAVAERAARRLARRGPEAVPLLGSLLQGRLEAGRKREARRAVWALSGIETESAAEALRAALGGPDPELATLAARALALRGDRRSAPLLLRLLQAGPPPAKLAAAEALWRCGAPEHLPGLWGALRDGPDPFLEHAVAHAIHRLAGPEELRLGLGDPDPRLQRAALLLLDQKPRSGAPREEVLARLAASDSRLRRTALAVLGRHPEWEGDAARLVRAWLEGPLLSPEEEAARAQLLAEAGSRTEVAAEVGRALERAGTLPGARLQAAIPLLGEAVPRASLLAALRALLGHADPTVRLLALERVSTLALPGLEADLERIAASASEAPEARLEAVAALAAARGPGASRGEAPPALLSFIIDCLRPDAGPLVRLRAADIIGRTRLDDAALVAAVQAARGDPLLGPGLILRLIARNPPRAPDTRRELLALLEEEAARGALRAAEGELRAALEALGAGGSAAPAALREDAAGARGGDRARLEALSPLLEGGNPRRGREVFLGARAACSTCHRIAGEGGRAGPDLTRVGAVRSGLDLLESIAFPGSTIAQGYDTYLLLARSGQAYTGVLASSPAGRLTLLEAGGAERSLRKEEVEKLERLPSSLMPEGLDAALRAEDLRDLLAYLQGLR